MLISRLYPSHLATVKRDSARPLISTRLTRESLEPQRFETGETAETVDRERKNNFTVRRKK